MVLLVCSSTSACATRGSGRAWIAVREDEVAAASMGVNLVRTKLWAYAIGAALGGFAGAFLGTYNNTVNVDQFEFGFSVFILAMVIIGGMGNIWGVVLGAVALSMLNRFGLTELNDVPDQLGLDFDVTSINFGIFGFLLLVMMVLRPEGLLPSRRRKLELHEAEIDEADAHQDRRATRPACTRCARVTRPAERRPRRHEHRRATPRRRAAARAPRRSRRSSAAWSPSTTSTSPCRSEGDRLADRAQRRRQDDVLQLPDRALPADDGPVTFDGNDITAKRPDLVTKAGVARTFQNIKLFRTMTALENVQVGMHAQHALADRRHGPPHAVRPPRGEGRRREGARAAATSSASSATTSWR